jgi:DNA-directed RNA polymerase specialized sigma24 family protein
MFQIARNCVVNLHRQRKDMASLDEHAQPIWDPRSKEPIIPLIDDEKRRDLRNCIALLGHPRRAIMESRLAGSDYQECAVAIGVTRQEAYSHFFAAKNLLLACMRSKQHEDD